MLQPFATAGVRLVPFREKDTYAAKSGCHEEILNRSEWEFDGWQWRSTGRAHETLCTGSPLLALQNE
jgi:hypothetical protein